MFFPTPLFFISYWWFDKFLVYVYWSSYLVSKLWYWLFFCLCYVVVSVVVVTGWIFNKVDCLDDVRVSCTEWRCLNKSSSITTGPLWILLLVVWFSAVYILPKVSDIPYFYPWELLIYGDDRLLFTIIISSSSPPYFDYSLDLAQWYS